MAMNDPIGDLITRIRNARDAQQAESVVARFAGCARSVLEVLKSEGYIRGFATVEHKDGRNEARDRAEIFRRRAGDPRDPARLQARPPRLCVGEEPAADQ